MLNKLCFWKRKRYWYVVFFSYTNRKEDFQTSWTTEATSEPIDMAHPEQLIRLRTLIESGSRFINSPHSRQRLKLFASEWQRDLTEAHLIEIRAEDDIHRNIKFLSVLPMGWDRY